MDSTKITKKNLKNAASNFVKMSADSPQLISYWVFLFFHINTGPRLNFPAFLSNDPTHRSGLSDAQTESIKPTSRVP